MVNVYFYNSDIDFKNNNPNNPNNHNNNSSISCTDKDFKRYLIRLGAFSNTKLSSNGMKFYFSLVKMAIIEKNGTFEITDDYFNAETSIKMAISYFIGSMTAYAIAEKVYKVPFLFHLKDPVIKNITRYNGYNNKSPDFFGFKNSNFLTPILIEAKGTYRSNLATSTVFKAKTQVNAIKSIDFRNSLRSITKFDRHVVGAYFKNRELNICDIDPEDTGIITYEFDEDFEILMYYKNIMFLILFNYENSKTITINNNNYIFVEFEGYKIGLNTFIFGTLEKYFRKDEYEKPYINFVDLKYKNETNLFETIFNYSSEIYNSYENHLKEDSSISIGGDGIIVM